MSKALAIISIILGVILVAGFAFGVYVLFEATDCFKSKPTDFWVIADGKRFNADNDIVLSNSSVDVRYLVGWLSRKQGYTYKIVPTGNDFGFTVNGNVCNWLGIKDLTKAFEIKERADGFTIKAYDKKLSDVLQVVCSNCDIVMPTLAEDSFCFKLIVTSADGKSIALTFRCTVAVDGIELNPPTIIF